MITNLKLKYYSCFKSFFGARQLIPQHYPKDICSHCHWTLSGFFAASEMSFLSTEKALVWKWSLRQLTFLRSLLPSASTPHTFSHLHILPQLLLSLSFVQTSLYSPATCQRTQVQISQHSLENASGNFHFIFKAYNNLISTSVNG